MKEKDRKLLLVGIMIALVIAVAAPFLASANPDGLESTAEEFESAEEKEEEVHESPMPDYIIPGLGENESSGVAAIVIGTVITLVIVLLLFFVLIKIKRSKGSRKTLENKGIK